MEQQLADEIAYVMRVKGVTQTDFAKHRNVTRQSVSPVFSGRSGLLTSTAADLLEWLGVRIKLELIEREGQHEPTPRPRRTRAKD
jgi:transcriptional regulator with XRE-family HTH domain